MTFRTSWISRRNFIDAFIIVVSAFACFILLLVSALLFSGYITRPINEADEGARSPSHAATCTSA